MTFDDDLLIQWGRKREEIIRLLEDSGIEKELLDKIFRAVMDLERLGRMMMKL